MNVPNSVEIIKQNNLCIGCGVCAGLCPAQGLVMEFNLYGEYNPVRRNSDCFENCGLCFQVCPFSDKEENEDSLAKIIFGNIEGIKHRSETGYYLDSYVGYSKVCDHRANGASGGVATWLLETLLAKQIIDYVICVTPHQEPEKLFRFAVFDTFEPIRRSARSAYYPVEMSEVVRYIIENEGRYAISGLPCFIKGLRLAARKNKKLRDRIRITIGLVCGQMKSKHYTSYLAFLAGVRGPLLEVNFRGKALGVPANNYFFQCTDQENNQGKLFWRDGVDKVWNNRWFTPRACSFCDDVFAELADVVLMDAWLPEYIVDWKGTNLIIVRVPLLRQAIESGIEEGQLEGKRISIDRIIQSQLGVLNVKRNKLAYRLYLAKQKGAVVPTKREAPSGEANFFTRKEIELKDKMQELSRELFLQCTDGGERNLKTFSDKMDLLVTELENWARFGRIVRLPARGIRKAAREIGRVREIGRI